MALDLKTITDNLEQAKAAHAKAQADIAFWEDAGRIFSDPRVAPLLVGSTDAPVRPRAYGEVKLNVHMALPDYGEPPLTSGAIVDVLLAGGFIFTASHPINAVNEALRALESEGAAVVVAKSGIAKLWNKSAAKQKPEAEALLDEIPF